MYIKYSTCYFLLSTFYIFLSGCSSSKVAQSKSNFSDSTLKNTTLNNLSASTTNESGKMKELSSQVNNIENFTRDRNSSFSNNIRVKTIYELAQEHNPDLFLPHDEFETAKEYEDRISRQVLLMKDIVLLSSKKMDIKKAEKLQLKNRKNKIEKQRLNLY